MHWASASGQQHTCTRCAEADASDMRHGGGQGNANSSLSTVHGKAEMEPLHWLLARLARTSSTGAPIPVPHVPLAASTLNSSCCLVCSETFAIICRNEEAADEAEPLAVGGHLKFAWDCAQARQLYTQTAAPARHTIPGHARWSRKLAASCG